MQVFFTFKHTDLAHSTHLSPNTNQLFLTIKKELKTDIITAQNHAKTNLTTSKADSFIHFANLVTTERQI